MVVLQSSAKSQKLSAQWAAAAGRLAVPVIALAVAALGVLNLWSALLAHGPGRAELLRDDLHLPLIVQHGSRTLIALFGLGLLMVARSLARQKRQAWRIASLMLAIAPFLHLAKGLDWEEAIICLLLLGVLFQYRHMFWAENDAPSARQGVVAASALFLFAALYGPCGLLLLRREFRPEPDLSLAARASIALLTFSNPDGLLQTRTHRAAWFEDTLLIISSFALSYGLFMLLRPVFPRDVAEEQQRRLARHLLARWGSSPLGYFALLPDKRYLFESDETGGEWSVAYRVVGQHAIALGDPLGDPARACEAITAFLRLCKGHDWKPSFYQVTGASLALFRAQGLKTLKIGQDSVIDLTSFTIKGKPFQDLRTALNKMAKLEILFEECRHGSSLDIDTLAQMGAISAEWLLSRHGTEKGFAMGSFDPQSELFHDSRVFTARQKSDGKILAFLTFVPIYGPDAAEVIKGWNLDLMRRATDAPNGVMEFLITSAAVLFQLEGAACMSLGLSPLSGSDGDEEPETTEIFERARGILFRRFNFFYSFDGLYGFKKKFAPHWDSRYLVYHSHADLLATIYAILEAHSPRRIATLVKQLLRRQ